MCWPQRFNDGDELTATLMMTLMKADLYYPYSYHSTNVVSGMVENLHRKKFSPARIGVGGCRLSVCLSVRLSVCLSVRDRYFVE
jgi:hypothetical protein